MSFLSRASGRTAVPSAFRFRSFEERLGILVFGLVLLFAAAQSVWAHEFKAGVVVIDHPWSRATPAGAKVAAGYLTLQNTGAEPDRLVSATAEIAGRTEIHEMAVDANGVMTMRPLADGIAVPAGGSVALEPSSFHVMFMDLKAAPEEGKPFKGTLTFEKAGTVDVEYAVEPIGGASGYDAHGAVPAEGGADHSHHGG